MIGVRTFGKFCCALCGDDIFDVQPRRFPLGKDDAIVHVCASCADGHARTVGPSEHGGYTTTSGALSNRDITAAMKRKMGEDEYARRTELAERAGRTAPPRMDPAERDLVAVAYERIRRRQTGAARVRTGKRQR